MSSTSVVSISKFDVVGDVALIAMNHANRIGSHDGDFIVGQIDDLVGTSSREASHRWR